VNGIPGPTVAPSLPNTDPKIASMITGYANTKTTASRSRKYARSS